MFRTLIAVVLSASLLTGCAAFDYTKSLFVSGVSLETVGEQFLQITDQVREGCLNGVIPVKTCVRYGNFHDNFVRAFPLAVGIWNAADKAGDAATKQKAEDVVRVLAKDMGKLAAEALGAFIPEDK